MLYKKNSAKELSKELFGNPTSEYRGTPFWALNSNLTTKELCRQIDVFKEMGLGGFHLHVRTGLENEYLSEEYMELIKDTVVKAEGEDMLAWLYDEDRWPSGAAGGLVTKDKEYRARCLLFTPFKEADCFSSDDSRAEGGRSGKGTLLTCYDIILDENGYLESYKRIAEDEEAQGTKWYAFLEIHTPSSWYNGQSYADTLSRETIEKFIEVTHEKYKAKVGSEFDKTVPAIFTDEPQFTRKTVLNNSFDKMDITMPWTDKVPQLYKEAYGADIFDTLPEVFWDLKDSAPSIHRYRYHDFIAELFAQAFADTVGSWCNENNIALTGHMMEEPTLRSQTAALGEAMRSYRSFRLPGIDMLCNSHEFTTAKQAQSAVHQFGYEGMLSELYGVTGWDCDFRTYKHQGDWQACLGVTIRVPHLSWYAMKGEAKRDYPVSIHYQSPWYKKYNIIEDHFARVNTALTRGKPVVKVGVIHPVESFWLHWGPNDKSAVFRESLDERFFNITKWLLEGSIDFNFISESLLPSQCEKGGAPLKVGKMEYDAVIVPGCETLRKTTLDILEQFRDAGGKLIFMGDAPSLIDASPCCCGKKLFDKSEKIDFSRASLLTALDSSRSLTIRYADGRLTDKYMYQLREDTDCRWLFICNSKEPGNKHVDYGDDIQIIINGKYTAEIYDTANGNIYPVKTEYQGNNTIIRYEMFGYDSLLLKLKSGKNDGISAVLRPEGAEEALCEACEYELSEDNILVLDMAQWKLDGDEEFSEKEEILRLDNLVRERLGFKERGGHVVQPWVLGKLPKPHKVTLKFTFNSDIDYKGAVLALEDAEDAEVVFNGNKASSLDGYYVDISIGKKLLGDIVKGENVLEITLPFGETAGLENVFVLGKFGVKADGGTASITALPEKLTFGSLLSQGLPFYSGAVTYKMTAEAENDDLIVTASDYMGALISVSVDGKERGDIVYPPYTLEIKGVGKGKHDVDVKIYLHRYNSFGPIHLVNVKESWHGPGAWRSDGINWSYEYVLRTTGIMKAPAIK
ncbi:MAG: hypothetical protein E7535_08740 [Ruminococcaceae bacterium]|nr:hypothetical protein [Oscillospiraceae bacterium]